MATTDQSMIAANTQTSQGLILQGYCNSVLQQASVNFGEFTNLAQFEKDINSGLITAKAHADDYLTNIQPAIISNISNIENYYQLCNSVPVVCPVGSSDSQWMDLLLAMQSQANEYQSLSSGIVTKLTTLNSNIGNDAASFASTVTKLNSAVNGDNGVLADLSNRISTVDKQIAGCIAGTTLSALAIVGGVFMIAVGGITDFVTAGTTTPLVIGGVAVLAAGIGGEVASALLLKSYYDQKASLLSQQSSLKNEVNLASGISSAYTQIGLQARSSMEAATQMANAWSSIGSDLGSMADDLKKGRTSTGILRSLWLNTANNLCPTILTDVNTIKAQMAGVQSVSSGTQNLGNYIVSMAQAA